MPLITAASFLTSSSEAPREARPISWLNCAKLGSASIGMCPRISCTQSLEENIHDVSWEFYIVCAYGSGV